MNQYQWRDSFLSFYKIDPNVAGAALSDLESSEGQLTAQGVVEAARPTTSPLHPAFEWDDAKAAESYRLVQARSMIKSIEIVVQSSQDTATPKTVYFNVPQSGETEGGYKSREVLASNVEEWELALNAAKVQLAGCLKSLRAIEELRPALSSKAQRKLTKATRSVEAAQADLLAVV